MDAIQFYRDRLAEHLDEKGDLAPPWEKFPTYERYTIGWRMGGGEDWLSYWYVFLETLAPSFDVRLAYLKRHPPAPVNWSDRVYSVLHPAVDDYELTPEQRSELLGYGLICTDASYPIWLRQQNGIRWPWEFAENPETATRYRTREFWFWSRQVAEQRGSNWKSPTIPDSWAA